MQVKELKALESIEKELKTLEGHLGFYYKNLKSGFEYGVNQDDTFFAASVIKLPLFLNVLLESEKGSISLDEKYLKLYIYSSFAWEHTKDFYQVGQKLAWKFVSGRF